ncbi:unconventional myosin-XV-like [Solea solea]|uniref:unconventional myosin-XV-like n=1 Tax=Solea solea TaxID=90069 RepID=UPI00272C3BE3|nr:unconventional myosin-XV-like [Solea solea]
MMERKEKTKGRDEELSEEDEEDDSEYDRRGKGRGGKAAQGKKGGRSRREEYSDEDDEEDEDEEEDEEDEDDYGKSKKKTKDKGKAHADAKKKKGRKKEEAPQLPVKEIPKKGLKNMSRMFMKFSGFKRRRNSTKKLKSTSRLFLGLGKRKFRLAKKKRRKSMLKNTSRFMMRFKASKKGKKEKEAKEKASDGKKPTYMLLRLGGNKEANEKKGGFFKNLFRKKDGDEPSDDFKNRSVLLGKVAAATNWLTKRFLSTKMRENSGHHGWGGRRAHSRQASSRRYLHGYHNNGYEHGEDVYGYDQGYSIQQKGYEDYYDGYGNYREEAAAAYDDQGQFDYYDDEAGGADHQDLGYYEEDGFYDPNAEYYEGGLQEEGMEDYYNPYSSAQGYYNNQDPYGYQQQQAVAMYGDEDLDYYALMGGDHMYGGAIDGFLDPQAQGYYDQNGQGVYYSDGQGAYINNGLAGYYENPYTTTMGMQGGLSPDYPLNYSDAGISYQDYSSQQAMGLPSGGQQNFGFDGQGMDQQQMMTDPMMMPQGYGPPIVPTPTAMIIKQANMSPLPSRRLQPSPTPSRRSVIMPSPQLQRHPSVMASPNASAITISCSPTTLPPTLSPCFYDKTKSSTFTKSINEAKITAFLTSCFHEEAEPPTIACSCS